MRNYREVRLHAPRKKSAISPSVSGLSDVISEWPISLDALNRRRREVVPVIWQLPELVPMPITRICETGSVVTGSTPMDVTRHTHFHLRVARMWLGQPITNRFSVAMQKAEKAAHQAFSNIGSKRCPRPVG